MVYLDCFTSTIKSERMRRYGNNKNKNRNVCDDSCGGGVAFAAYWILGYSSEQNIMESLKLCKFATDMGAAEIAVIFSSVI